MAITVVNFVHVNIVKIDQVLNQMRTGLMQNVEDCVRFEKSTRKKVKLVAAIAKILLA